MRYLVRAGDCAASVAARFGLSTDDLLALGDNSRLSEGGRDPHILRPGETIEVPEPSGSSASFSSGGTRRFRVTVPTTLVRTQLFDRQRREVANRPYELVVAGRARTGHTDGAGFVEERVPAVARSVTLRVWVHEGDEHPFEEEIALGAVDPIEEESGVIHRLANLGYGSAEHGARGVAWALMAFQRAEGLTVTGELDAATRDRLRGRHGS